MIILKVLLGFIWRKLMGKDFHECVVVGRTAKEPEMRYTPSGKAVTTVTLAVSDDYYDKNKGEWVNRANFFRYVF